jgi:CHAT domain-containing protein/tetratricopeptide (TPR) repeat protein
MDQVRSAERLRDGRGQRRVTWRACCAACALLAAVSSVSASDRQGCDEALRADDHGRAAAECLWKLAVAEDRRNEALARLEEAGRRHPTWGWITFYLAEIHSTDRSAETLALFASAIEKFARLSDRVGETEARLRLGNLLIASGRWDDAWLEAPRAIEAARRSGDPLVITRAILHLAELAERTGERLALALQLLKEAEQHVFPGGPYTLQRRVLRALGRTCFDLGQYDRSRAHYAALVDLARDNDDQALVVRSSYGLLGARRKQMEELPEPDRLPEFIVAAREMVTLAEATGEPLARALAHRALADLLWPVVENRADAEAHYRMALTQARAAANASLLSSALWALGRMLYLSDRHLAEAGRLIDEALALAVDSASPTFAAYAWRQQMRLAWKRLPRERAAAESVRALDAIEALRTLQAHGVGRAAVLGAWTPDYHWLIGALLDTETPTRADVSLAFDVGERMRARLLLDSLLRSPQPDEVEPSAASLERRRLLQGISAVQTRLLDPRVQGAARAEATAQLEQLEREEEGVRAQLDAARSGTGFVVPTFASLADVESSLREDEALLSFTVGVGRNFYGEFAGGAWLLASARTGTRVIRLPDRTKLHAVLSIFRGLAEQSDEGSVDASVRLHQLLLEEALASLPRSVGRLILVPDGPLHHMPFAALRPTPVSAPLGTTHEIVVAPSASVWVHLRQQAPLADGASALVLADPRLPEPMQRNAMAEEREWLPGMSFLGALPHARREGRAIMTHLGRRSRVLSGAAATEAAVKGAAADPYAILHFATHALVDDVNPDRSAVLLAGGASGEDGLLQAREIADLPLQGRIVVLSACRSATGTVLAGEGVLGLSRSFLEAGARTVVGTLWAIRDDHAAVFFEAFYASLARGHSVGTATRDARRQAIGRGLPASVWASVVVIGDDTARIPRKPLAWWNIPGVTTWIGLLLLATLLAGTIGRRRRTARARATLGEATQG